MAEYIEREELMKFPIRRNHYDKEHGNEHFINGIETVLEYAENLPAADVEPVRRWTPVSEKMPEERGFYLVAVKHWRDGKPVPREAFWNEADWLSREKRMEITPRVTHWMSLPEPPEMDGGADHETETVDEVPVVRCRDCKYSYEDISGRCCSHGPCKDWVVLDDSFCSQGERRTGNGKAVDEG